HREYQAAAEQLAIANARASELTDAERRELDSYLRRSQEAEARQASATKANNQLASAFTPAGSTAREQANSLLEQANRHLEAGELAQARELAARAERLPVKWRLFDERPHHLIAKINRRIAESEG